MLILTFVMGSTLATVGPVVGGSLHAERALHAATLGDELMREVLALPYEDPVEKMRTFGPEAGESGSGRAGFDDVDDYAAYKSVPPVGKDGKERPGSDEYVRMARVAWFDPETFGAAKTETGMKRVEVEVYYGKSLLYTTWSFVSQTEPRG